MLLTCFRANSLHVAIIESQSINPGYVMDLNWSTVVSGMGHTSQILPQTALDNISSLNGYDLLIVSSAIMPLTTDGVNTITQFLKSGRPVYLQCEYLTTYTTNEGFEEIIRLLGGSFEWKYTVMGDLVPMHILGNFATTPNTVNALQYYWYSVAGIGDCDFVNFLEYNNEYHGFQYISPNTSYGSIVTTADQDWVRDFARADLMENILANLISPVKNSPALSFDLGTDKTLCLNETLELDVHQNSAVIPQYLWQDGTSAAVYTIAQPGTYWVQVTGKECKTSDTIHIQYEDCTISLEMPNLLTPNADGINDLFRPVEMKNISSASLVIYNRWGQRVLETNNLQAGWDGSCSGRECPDGTYFWTVNYVAESMAEQVKTGYLTLLK
ncbi:MAG: hypothetical protein K0S33_83 [Bacteroidetes bacterium]|jgi:gliding motility-associated-like protein|nr:hypothetical protein [Bacteroidota bacterium]